VMAFAPTPPTIVGDGLTVTAHGPTRAANVPELC
jgi:hypothetical protein